MFNLWTNSMDQISLWDAKSYSAGEEFPHSFWNPAVTRVQHQTNPIQNLPCYFFKTNFNIILIHTSRSLSCRFTEINVECIYLISHVCYIPHPSHLPWFVHVHIVWWRGQILRKLLYSLLLRSISWVKILTSVLSSQISFALWSLSGRETKFHTHNQVTKRS
jgi:hypothetical protein